MAKETASKTAGTTKTASSPETAPESALESSDGSREILSRYAAVAERYWQTYLPTMYASLAPQNRESFFAELAGQVAETVDILAEDNLRASSRPGDSPQRLRRKAAMARLRAEEEALADMVYLPKETGTAHREPEPLD